MIGKTINNYKITHFIGKGGMGSVYLAKHIVLGKLMAIKFLNPGLVEDEELRKRFISEAKIQAHLDGSKGLVTIYDFVEDEGRFYIFMEFVSGIPLNKYIRNNGVLSEPEAISYFIDILKAMNEAHEKGVIHRDLKPPNIMITKDNNIKIMDFGIAKLMGENHELTKAGTKIGSSRYMSPEQVRGEELDYRTDIYTLGLILYEMLVGTSPYKAETKSEYVIYDSIINKPLPKLGKGQGSSFLQSIIDKATEKNKEDRFQSINEFISAFDASTSSSDSTISSSTIDASKTTYGEAAYEGGSYAMDSKDLGRNYLWLIVGGIAMLLMVLSVVGYLWFSDNIDIHNQDKVEQSEQLTESKSLIEKSSVSEFKSREKQVKLIKKSKQERATAAYQAYLDSKLKLQIKKPLRTKNNQ